MRIIRLSEWMDGMGGCLGGVRHRAALNNTVLKVTMVRSNVCKLLVFLLGVTASASASVNANVLIS